MHNLALGSRIYVPRLGFRCAFRGGVWPHLLGPPFPHAKQISKPTWSLGRLSKPFQAISVLWNGWVVAILYSPYVFPVSADTLNYAPVIMAIVTIFAILSWWIISPEKWLPSKIIQETLDAGEVSK